MTAYSGEWKSNCKLLHLEKEVPVSWKGSRTWMATGKEETQRALRLFCMKIYYT